jgi:hypothetical protein
METQYNLDESALEIITRFKKFEKKSYEHWKSLFENIENDRKFIGGEQYSNEDRKVLGDDFKDATLNVVNNAIRSIVNSYTPYKYGWNFKDLQDQPLEDLNKKGQLFLSLPDNCTAAVESLTNAVGTGLGVMVFSNDYDIDGSVKPLIYSIADVTTVRLDPNMTKVNGSDAKECAIVEIKPKEWLRSEYPEADISFSDSDLISVSKDYDKKDYAALITYYIKSGLSVNYYKMVGNTILENGVLPFSYIPVIPVFGEQIWSDNKITYTGITGLMRSIQRLINYSYRQLLIRCSKVPKNTWAAEAESVENYEKYYQNADKTLNPLLLYKKWSNDGKRELAAPQRLSNVIEFTDVSELMQNALQLTNTIIGIPATGLETNVEKTATEVLTNLKTFNNNIRNYIQHLRLSFQMIGMLFADYDASLPQYGKLKVDVVQGPDEAMQKQEARVALQQYAGLVSTDEDRQKLLIANCKIESDNPYITTFGKMLVPVPTDGELQAQNLLGKASEELKQKDMQILELQKQLFELQNNEKLNAYSLEREITLSKLKHEQEMEKLAFEAQLEQSNPAEQAKTQAEVAKAEMSVEKEALSLAKEQEKARQPEVNVMEVV